MILWIVKILKIHIKVVFKKLILRWVLVEKVILFNLLWCVLRITLRQWQVMTRSAKLQISVILAIIDFVERNFFLRKAFVFLDVLWVDEDDYTNFCIIMDSNRVLRLTSFSSWEQYFTTEEPCLLFFFRINLHHSEHPWHPTPEQGQPWKIFFTLRRWLWWITYIFQYTSPVPQILFQNWIHFLRKTSCWHFPKLMLSIWNGNIQQNWMIDSDRFQEYAHLHKWEGFLRKKSQLSLSQIFFFQIWNCSVFILIKRWPQSYVIKRFAKKSFQESYMLLLWHFS